MMVDNGSEGNIGEYHVSDGKVYQELLDDGHDFSCGTCWSVVDLESTTAGCQCYGCQMGDDQEHLILAQR